MYYIYILRSLKTNQLYTGSTENIQRRLAEHNSGKSKSTKSGAPFELLYQEGYDSRSLAYKRELFFKTGKGRDELKIIIRGIGAVG